MRERRGTVRPGGAAVYQVHIYICGMIAIISTDIRTVEKCESFQPSFSLVPFPHTASFAKTFLRVERENKTSPGDEKWRIKTRRREDEGARKDHARGKWKINGIFKNVKRNKL